MFSFIKQYAQTLHGVDLFGNIALVLFLTVFAAAVLFAIKANKQYIHELEQIPFN